MEDDAKRALPFPALLNARDLGGCPIAGGARTRWRSLLRSDDLARLTPGGLQLLAAHGVETVIDLRWPEEIAGSPSPVKRHLPHVRYEQVSLLGPSPDAWVARCQGYPKEHW